MGGKTNRWRELRHRSISGGSPWRSTEGAEPLLVVEVAESSLRNDLDAKAALYAEAGVPEYWVLNLVDRELSVFRSSGEGAYRYYATYREGDRVAPEAGPDVTLELGDLFPAKDPS